MKKVLGFLANVIATIPVSIAQLIAFAIGILSYVGSVFLAIGVETHKALKTPTGLKLIEVDKTVKKVTDYIDKVNKAAAASQANGASANGANKQQSGQESLRLFNIVKNDGGNGNGSGDSNS